MKKPRLSSFGFSVYMLFLNSGLNLLLTDSRVISPRYDSIKKAVIVVLHQVFQLLLCYKTIPLRQTACR